MNICIIAVPEVEKKENGTEAVWRNTGWKFSQSAKRHQPTDLRISTNLKQNKHKIKYTKAQYVKIVGNYVSAKEEFLNMDRAKDIVLAMEQK